MQPQQVQVVAIEDQPDIEPLEQPPAAGTPYLAVFWHDEGSHPVRYYPLQPNTVFQVPAYSVFSAAGPAGGAGAPRLSVNLLLKRIGSIVLV
jgi:hypothetical protein